MLTNQSIASKVCFNCSIHHLNKILYFCGHLDCNVVLCIECKGEHNRNHQMKKTNPLLLNFPFVVVQVKERLITAMRFLDNLVDELESKDILEQNSDSICVKQKDQGLEEMVLEMGSLRSKWKGYLCDIETDEASEVIKLCYNFDFQKVICSLKENIFKTVQPYLFHEVKIRQNSNPGLSCTEFQKGLGSILEQIRNLRDNQSQPVQSGREEEKHISPKAVDSHCRTYIKRPSQLIVPLTPTNLNFPKNPQLSSIPVSPAMTIMEDSQAASPLTGETISLNEFSAKRKSRYGSSPYSLYNTKKSEVQIDTFEMIEEEQGERF